MARRLAHLLRFAAAGQSNERGTTGTEADRSERPASSHTESISASYCHRTRPLAPAVPSLASAAPSSCFPFDCSDLDLPDAVLRVGARLSGVVPDGRLRRVVGGCVDLGVRRRVPHGRSRVVQRDAQSVAEVLLALLRGAQGWMMGKRRQGGGEAEARQKTKTSIRVC